MTNKKEKIEVLDYEGKVLTLKELDEVLKNRSKKAAGSDSTASTTIPYVMETCVFSIIYLICLIIYIEQLKKTIILKIQQSS